MAENNIIKFIFQGKDELSDKMFKITAGIAGMNQALELAKKGFAQLKKAYEFAEAGAQAERLQAAGESLASSFGQNMDSIVESIQEASGETVDRMSAMSAANKAMILDVAKTPEEFDKLTKAAIALGRATGRTATQSIEDLTTGIGRQSKLILDNLGIVYDAEKLYKDYAKQLGKTVDELTDYEKKQALVNIAIEKANLLLDENGELIEDAASEYERLKANISDVTLEQKQLANEALFPLVRTYNDLADNRDKFTEAVEKGIISQRAANIATLTGLNNYINLSNGLQEWEDQFGTTAAEIEAEAKRFAPNVASELSKIEDQTRNNETAMKDWGKSALYSMVSTKLWQEALADGFISEGETETMENAARFFGQELPEDFNWLIGVANTYKGDLDAAADGLIADMEILSQGYTVPVQFQVSGQPGGVSVPASVNAGGQSVRGASADSSRWAAIADSLERLPNAIYNSTSEAVRANR